ncbi:MAG TPA: diphthine--ammonia ligase [Myxococcota bacterium]
MGVRASATTSILSPGKPFCCSWSGGKDSCLALYRAIAGGGIPRALVTVFSENETRTRSHGLHRSVVDAQAEALGLELRTVSTSWDNYRENLVGVLGEAREDGIACVVFGDIDIEAHRQWELAVARDADMRAFLPLWGAERRSILEDWWRLKFEARIVVVREGVLARDYLGRSLDAGIADELENQGVDACGENGEFHTLAVDGPLFRHPLTILPGPHVRRSDCWVEDLRVA